MHIVVTINNRDIQIELVFQFSDHCSIKYKVLAFTSLPVNSKKVLV